MWSHVTLYNSRPIAVFCANTGNLIKYYIGGRYAAKKLNITYGALQRALYSNYKTSGYKFKYIEDEKIISKVRHLYAKKNGIVFED